jgi:hypothetical protein
MIISPAGKEGSVRLSGSVPPESAGLTYLAELSRGRDLLTSPERRNVFVDEVRMGFRADFERAPGSRPKRKFLSFVGLANVRKRLELLFPGRHELAVEETPELYRVRLRLPHGEPSHDQMSRRR